MKKIFKLIITTILFIGLILICNNVQAASASISANETTVSVGTTIKVTVSVNAAQWDLNTSADSGLTYVSGQKRFYELDNASKNLSKSTTLTYKASKKGNFKINLKGNITDINGETLEISKPITIKVTEASTTNNNNNKDDDKNDSTKSTNANLSTLGVTPKEYDFSGFSKDKTSYSVTVPNDVNSLKVAYKTADAKATVKVTGNNNLEVGTNTIKIVVTAEDGKTTKTYTIKVTKLATEDNKPGNVIDEENDLDLCLTSLSVKGLELTPEFSSNVYSYETTIDMDNNDMSEVAVEAASSDSKATIEITGNTNLVEGENLINVIVKASNSSEQTVYQITVNKISKASEIVSSNNIIDKIKNIKREHLIIGSFILIVVIILAIIIIKEIRDRRYYYDDEEDEEENENELYNQDNEITERDNLVEELFAKKNKQTNIENEDKETIEEIQKENDRIFHKEIKEESIENEEISDSQLDDIEERIEKRKKGKHF